MKDQQSRQAHPLALMRGGTSRGAVLHADRLPSEASSLDVAMLGLVGGEADQIDGVGGGTPTTNKVVVVRAVLGDGQETILEYSVGNVAVGQNLIDWSGTCGNMTAAVPVFALEEGLVEARDGKPIRLRNTSTGGIVEAVVANPGDHRSGQPVTVTTRYLEPGGSVCGRMLPTGLPVQQIRLGPQVYQASLVDVTHPYLFLLFDEVVGHSDLREPETLALIERLRGECCVLLGAAVSAQRAAVEAPAVPRVVLLHSPETSDQPVRITAVSMGLPIASIPVTAAMCIAAARRIPNNLVAQLFGQTADDGTTTIVSPKARMTASCVTSEDGSIASATVDRTVRTIVKGTAWI